MVVKLTLPLTPVEEEKLRAKARAEGTTPEQVVRRAIEPILAGSPHELATAKKPKKPLLGILAKYGPGPSEEDIAENRKEMFANFGRDDIA
jgi:hypothetical protein